MSVAEFSKQVQMIVAAHAPGSKSAKVAALLLVIGCLRSWGFGLDLDQLLELLDPAQEKLTTDVGIAALAVDQASKKEPQAHLSDTPQETKK